MKTKWSEIEYQLHGKTKIANIVSILDFKLQLFYVSTLFF